MTVSSFVTLTSKIGSFNLLFRFLGDGSVYVSVGFDGILVGELLSSYAVAFSKLSKVFSLAISITGMSGSNSSFSLALFTQWLRF